VACCRCPASSNCRRCHSARFSGQHRRRLLPLLGPLLLLLGLELAGGTHCSWCWCCLLVLLALALLLHRRR
jgi:hypothetical protein